MTIDGWSEPVAKALAKALSDEWVEPGNGVTVKIEELAKGGNASKVHVVMEEYPEDDDGDYNRDVEAVHASREGAEANLTPEISTVGYSRVRYIVEMELLP